MNGERVKIAVIGFGAEGHSLIKFFQKRLARSAEIWVLDKDRAPWKSRIKGVKYRFGSRYLNKLEDFDLIFRSPGVPYLSSEIQRAIRLGIPVSSATNLFFSQLTEARGKKKFPKIIAITGTKGKGTVSSLVYQILKKAGKKAVLAGNIGFPVLEALAKAKKADYVVLELSSFQLQDLKYPPDIAVVLPISSDHLDHHVSMREYANAKQNVAAHQEKGQTVIYFQDNHFSKLVGRKSRGKRVAVPRKSKLFAAQDLKLLGEHNYRNAIAALLAAKVLKIPNSSAVAAIESFKGLEHRLEFVRKVDGVSFINDSMSTNPATAIAAVGSFDKPMILIMGGKDKGLDYRPLKGVLKDSLVKAIILLGENSKKIMRSLDFPGVVRARNLKIATKHAFKMAKRLPAKIVLLSPASASFDMFKNAYERGDKFKDIVKRL